MLLSINDVVSPGTKLDTFDTGGNGLYFHDVQWDKLILTSWEIADNADLVEIVPTIKVVYCICHYLLEVNYIIIILLWYMGHIVTSKYYIY